MTARTSTRTAARPAGHVRRRSPAVKRRSAGLTAVRAGALLAMVGAALAGYGLASSPVFGLDRISTTGVVLTDGAAVRAVLDVPPGTNLVSLDTARLATRLEALPTVRAASVSAALPGTLHVQLTERRPILAWAVGDRRFLVDVDGRMIAELAKDEALPRVNPDGSVVPAAGTTATTAPPGRAAQSDPLPLLVDGRASGPALEVGDRLDPILLDAARRIGSVGPSDVGSAAAGLTVSVDDKDGFVVRPIKGGWAAVFGFYTPTLRSPELVPGQVRLLRSLLVGRETEVARVVLASQTDGTYVPRPSPSPSPSVKP
jgi:hypothetical protein